MKKLALIALIMVLGLSGCASGVGYSIKEDWTEYWKNPGGLSWEIFKGDWTEYWKNPGIW